MTPHEAREIAIRVLRGRNCTGTDEVKIQWPTRPLEEQEVRREAAAVLEAQANVEEKKAAFLAAAMSFAGKMAHPHWCGTFDRPLVEAFEAILEAERKEAS